MTKFFPLFACSLLIISCSTFKQVDKLTKAMRVGSQKYFIIKNNGDTLFGSKITGPDGSGKAYNYHIKRSPFITLDRKNYLPDEVKSFQDDYAFYSKKVTKNILGKEVSRFVKLLRKGKINLFIDGDRKDYNDNIVDIFCFQKGDQPIKELSKDEIAALLSDNKEALDKFNSYFKPQRKHFNVKPLELKKIIEVVEIYNRA